MSGGADRVRADLARRIAPATRARQARAFGAAAAAPRPPAILKCISVQHGRSGARATLRYVARLREADRESGDPEPALYDEVGDPVARGRAFDILDSWGLADEAAGESDLARALRAAAEDAAWRSRLLAWRDAAADAAADEARRADARKLAREARLRVSGERAAAVLRKAAALASRGVRAEDLAPSRRYARVATRHLAASVPLADERQAGRFEIAVAGFVRETFGAEGRPVLWAVHHEHGKEVHAHLLVRNRGAAGRALTFDRDGAQLDRLREALARHARACGLDAEATLHGDRPELVAAVADGRAALPRARGRHEARSGQGVARLAEAAPAWLVAHGAAYGQRLLARALGQSDPDDPRSGPDAAPEGYEEVAAHLLECGVYGDPASPGTAIATARAVDRFAALREEEMRRTGKDRLARWYLVRAPLLFGSARRGKRPDPAVLAAAFRRLPASPKPVVLSEVNSSALAQVEDYLSAVHEHRRRAHRRVVDLARLARQRETLARRLEGFGGVDDLKAAVELRGSAAALLSARRGEVHRLIGPLRGMAARDRGGRGRGD